LTFALERRGRSIVNNSNPTVSVALDSVMRIRDRFDSSRTETFHPHWQDASPYVARRRCYVPTHTATGRRLGAVRPYV